MIKNSGIVTLIAVLMMLISGCEKEDDDSSVTMVSRHNETESHKNGEACMACHSAGSDVKGLFTIAGSVFAQNSSTARANGTIYLYTQPAGVGSLIATIEVDSRGNFYTTASSIPASGAYVQIKGASGDIQNMSQIVLSGNCNNCHGVGTGSIWVN